MRILLLEEVHPNTNEWLNQRDIKIFRPSDGLDIDYKYLDAIITRGIGKIDKEVIDKSPNIRVVARCGVGLDNIDVNACTEKGIKVIYAPGSNAQTTAEHTITLLLNLQRNVFKAINDVKNGHWERRNSHVSDEVFGKNLGIIGYGNIGQKVATIANAFGMNVSYWSRNKVDAIFPYLSFDEIIQNSDIISIHLPLNNSTENLFDSKVINKCKPGILIINTARDKIFDRKALLEGLNNERIGGYAADVPQSPYPIPTDELNLHPKTLITPHVSSLTDHTFYQMCQTTVENVVKFLKGEVIDTKFIKN